MTYKNLGEFKQDNFCKKHEMKHLGYFLSGIYKDTDKGIDCVSVCEECNARWNFFIPKEYCNNSMINRAKGNGVYEKPKAH